MKITPRSGGRPPQADPIQSSGPETGGFYTDEDRPFLSQAPLSMETAVLDIGARGLGEEMDSADPLTAWIPGRTPVPAQNPLTDLQYIRSVFPFVSIMPFPNEVVSLVLPTANVADVLNFPDGTVIANFDADGQDWWISNYSRAAVPTLGSGDPNSPTNLIAGTAMVHPPNNVFFYIFGIKQLSCISTTPGRIVQARCWFAPIRPKPRINRNEAEAARAFAEKGNS